MESLREEIRIRQKEAIRQLEEMAKERFNSLGYNYEKLSIEGFEDFTVYLSDGWNIISHNKDGEVLRFKHNISISKDNVFNYKLLFI